MPSFLSSWSSFFSSNPTLFLLQILMLTAAVVLVFLVLFTLRDVLLRTHSFLFQVFSILLVAALPFFGFFLYLILRPSRTNAQRLMEHKVDLILHHLQQNKQGGKPQQKPQQAPGFKMNAPKQQEKKS